MRKRKKSSKKRSWFQVSHSTEIQRMVRVESVLKNGMNYAVNEVFFSAKKLTGFLPNFSVSAIFLSFCIDESPAGLETVAKGPEPNGKETRRRADVWLSRILLLLCAFSTTLHIH